MWKERERDRQTRESLHVKYVHKLVNEAMAIESKLNDRISNKT
jgi:hypothetical protein